ncbi:MAG: metallophosphoesterase [Pseudomonadota bacterium]
MFRLAHISDPHLGPIPALGAGDYFNKRVLGLLFWKGNRKRHMGAEWRNRLVADLKDTKPDHIAVTGDVTNLALGAEFERGREWLESLGAPHDVSVIPGNHDAYIRGAFKRHAATWAAYMSGDAAAGTVDFPYLRRRADVSLIGTSTGIAMPPFVAGGVFGSAQATRLEAMLGEPSIADTFRVVMIHHPPHRQATLFRKSLFDAAVFREVIARKGADLILHGHTHLATRAEIAGPDGPVPVICVPATSNGPGATRPAGRYNLFDIERAGSGAWQALWTERGHDSRTGELVTFRDRESIG